MRKVILFLLILFCTPNLQAQQNAFTVQPLTGERVQVVGGTIFTGSANVSVPTTVFTLTDGATSSIFITSAGILTVGTSGMGSNFPIATVITLNGNIVSITDNRANAVIGGAGFGFGNPAGPVINPKVPSSLCSGCTAVGDAQSVNDGVVSAGANATVTSATANFSTTATVGQLIYCHSAAGGANNTTVYMPVGSKITSITSNTIVVTNGTGTSGTVLKCVWYTQDDTAAILAAVNAAKVNANMQDTNNGPFLNPTAKTVYVPEGGYVVSSRFYNLHNPGNTNACPRFIGAGEDHTQIFVSPSVTDTSGDGGGVLMEGASCIGGEWSNLTIDGGGGFKFSYTHNLVRCFSCNSMLFNKIRIINIGTTGTTSATLSLQGCVNCTLTGSTVENAPGSTTDYALDLTSASTTSVIGGLYGNHNGGNLISASNGARSTNGGPVSVIGVTLDECAPPVNTFCTDLTGAGAEVIFQNDTMYGGVAGAISVGGTSEAWLENVNCGGFGSFATAASCITEAAGALIYVSGSTLRSNGTSLIANGPSTATLVDFGGNQWQNCVNAVCSAVTATNMSTVGFSLSGVFPKATVTHTPNTCYAVTGNLLATAQNLCQILLDQNYSVVNITAQSGGTTPANSSCTGAPVITMSDGTRTATLTMTTGKAAWSSSVDAVTNLNQVFASGSTLTVSIGANTCATPPANVSVNYVLQSVLNP